jgi:sugar phosphate permease
MWGTAMVAQLFNLFHRIAGATIADRLMADFDLSATTAGTLLALLFYVYSAMQFPSGALADSLGPRKTITAGSLISSIGAIIFSLAPSLPVLFVGRFLVSLGVSVIFISVLKISAVWFNSRDFGFMAALTGMISQAGALFATTPLALLVTMAGWRASFQLVGLMSLTIGVVCWIVLRSHPHDKGLPSPTELERQESEQPVQFSSRPSLSLGQRIRLVVTNRYTWPPFMVGIGLYGSILTFAGAWGIPYLMQVYNMTRSNAANYTLLVMVGMMVGSLIVAYLSNRVLQRRKPLAMTCIPAYLALWLLLTFWNPGNLSSFTLGVLFFSIGLFSGYQSQNLASVKEITPAAASGLAMGFVNIGPFLTTAILQPLFGRVLDLGWQGAFLEGARSYPVEAYHQAFLLLCGAAAISAIGGFLVKETYCRDLESTSGNR